MNRVTTRRRQEIPQDAEYVDFRMLDVGYVNPTTIDDISFCCKANRISVSSVYTLPIPISFSKSALTYRFSTEYGDISFSMTFVPDDGGEEEIVIPSCRVESDECHISGTIDIETTGTIILIWDNSYSWFVEKKLTYYIEVEQTTFVQLESNRIKKSQGLLQALYVEYKAALPRLAKAKDTVLALVPEIADLEVQISEMQNLLTHKRSRLHAAKSDKHKLTGTIKLYEESRDGLLIRVLDRKLTKHVLSFVDYGTTRLVCKFWLQLVTNTSKTELVKQRKNDPSFVTRPSLQETQAPVQRAVRTADSDISEESDEEVGNGSTAPIGADDSLVSDVKSTLASIRLKEKEKNELRRQIGEWKNKFILAKGREPSDAEKLHHVPQLYKDYFKIKKALKQEEKRIVAMFQRPHSSEENSAT